jgi:RNA polymerase sigma-70 factor (ECF subfamily)
MTAAREGDFTRVLALLAPDVTVSADAAAATLGTPAHMEGSDEVANFFNGAAAAAFPVFVEDRPGSAWIHRGEVKVAFDFTIEDGKVRRLQFRAEPELLRGVRRRDGDSVRD